VATHTSQPQFIAVGAGVIYWAPLATAEPTWTSASSVAAPSGAFTNAVSATWLEVGATEDGLTFSEQRATADLTPEESFVPEKVVTTSITASVSFSMWYIHDKNWKLAHNGGAWTSATGATGVAAVNSYTPPTPGAETRCSLLWLADDNTQAFWFPQAFNTANVSVPMKKGPNKAILPVEFRLEMPSTGSYYKRVTAGQTWIQP
jgi:hypothetical protein